MEAGSKNSNSNSYYQPFDGIVENVFFFHFLKTGPGLHIY